MSEELAGKKIAFLVSNFGVEDSELVEPWDAVKEAGGLPRLVSLSGELVQTVSGADRAQQFQPDLLVAQTDGDEFDALVLPGGVANPDRLRMDADAVAFAKEFASKGKPIAAICHGPWTLVEAGLTDGKTLTSWPSLRTDIENAGGSWVDEEVFVCPANGYTLVTSRKPDDLPAFEREMVKAFS